MHITRIKVENVRGFLGGESATDLQLSGTPGWYVFAGRNGAGKSTLLRAVALALVGPDHARRLMQSFAGWIRNGASSALASVEVATENNDEVVGAGRPKKSFSATLTWKGVGGAPEPEMASPHPRGRGPWRGPWNENPRGWMVAGYGPFRRLTGHGTEAQRAMSGGVLDDRAIS